MLARVACLYHHRLFVGFVSAQSEVKTAEILQSVHYCAIDLPVSFELLFINTVLYDSMMQNTCPNMALPRKSQNVTRMRMQCVPGLLSHRRPGYEAKCTDTLHCCRNNSATVQCISVSCTSAVHSTFDLYNY